MEKIPARIEAIREKLEAGFLGFWVRKYRISYLIVLALMVIGIASLVSIPKESSPNIKYGIVSLVTVYPGTNPVDMDSLVTEKLYKEIKDIDGAKKITSSSSLGVSSITIELQPETNVTNYMTEVRNNIGRVTLPTDAKNPTVTEIKSDTNRAYDVTLYSPDQSVGDEKLRILVAKLKDKISSLSTIEKVEYTSSNIYDIRLVFDENELKAMSLTFDQISAAIKAYHKDAPIGNFEVGDRNYDFRIGGKFEEAKQFLDVPVTLSTGKTIKVGDIAHIERYYEDRSIPRVAITGQDQAAFAVTLRVNKNSSASIFSAANDSKKMIVDTLATADFKGVKALYQNDLAENISDDYADLVHEAIVTLGLVFVCMWLFVGFFDSLFASLTLPLAFLSTFTLLDEFGYSLNFLTNFSLILSFGIAVDTIIVIVQAASAKIRIGHNPRSAIMIALKEYAVPVMAGVMTTILAFVPMMVLPGVMGRYLAYIPITILGVLASGLVLALTVNSALYIAFVKNKKTYVHDDTTLEYADEEEKELLEYERIGKTEVDQGKAPFRLRMIHAMTHQYKRILSFFLKNTFMRRASIFVLIGIFIGSFLPIFAGESLASLVGFKLMGASDKGVVSYSIYGANGENVTSVDRIVPEVAKIFSKYKEIESYTITTKDVKNSTDPAISISMQLKKLKDRETLGMMDVWEFNKKVDTDFNSIRSAGFRVDSTIAEGGPPSGKAVAIKLIADSADKLDTLSQVAVDFEKEIRSYQGVKNIQNTSGETPGQFVYSLKRDAIIATGISPSAIIGEMLVTMNGSTVGTIANGEDDLDVVLKYSQYSGELKPDAILSHTFKIGTKTYRLGDFIEPVFKNAVANVKREAGKITVSVGADLETGYTALDVQSKYNKYAESYKFPSGISYTTGGENSENQDLVVAVLKAFFIAILAIFALLTLLFNSYSQPVIVLYSVVMSLPFVMVGLLLTGNQFSLTFGIGFIAFTGIAVNHGIILIDAININLRKGMTSFTALIEAGTSRLEPMLLTTIATALGMVSIAMKDKFWSGLGYTVIFGLIACTIITLFVVKGLYYEVFMVDHHFAHRFLHLILWLPKKIFGVIRSIFTKWSKNSSRRSQ